MDIQVSTVQRSVPVAVMTLNGDLDASSYLQVIERAREAHTEGAKAVVLDLSKTGFVSSSGLVAIHSIALLLQGKATPDPESGWSAIRSMSEGTGEHARECLKLAGPSPRVVSTLDKVGFKEALDIYSNVESALASL